MLQSLGSQRVGHNLATEQQHLNVVMFISESQFYWGVCPDQRTVRTERG